MIESFNESNFALVICSTQFISEQMKDSLDEIGAQIQIDSKSFKLRKEVERIKEL